FRNFYDSMRVSNCAGKLVIVRKSLTVNEPSFQYLSIDGNALDRARWQRAEILNRWRYHLDNSASMVLASDGIWAGLVGIQPITIPSIIDDPPTPDPQEEKEEIVTKPYAKVIQFCSSLAVSEQVRAYPYELDLPPISITSGLGINFLDLTASPPIVDVFGTGAKAGGATGRGETPTVRGVTLGAQAGGAIASGETPRVRVEVSGTSARGTRGQGDAPIVQVSANN
ncbi:MAG: hypothetical protein AB4290_16870, partial [Spirulina sp.]